MREQSNKSTVNQIIDQSFFERSPLIVAKELLGKYLVRRFMLNGKIIEHKVILNELEAYDGPNDLACHASKGCTERTKVLFGPPGHIYVYLCYGMHWMLNIVTGPENYPSAVLIRGVSLPESSMDLNGPGKVTKFLQIDKTLNTKIAQPENGLWIERSGIKIPANAIKRTPRIGVDYAGPIWSKKEYRFQYLS